MKKITLTIVLFSIFLVSCTDQTQELQNLQNESNQTKEYQLRIDPSDDGSIDDEYEIG